MCSLDLCTRCGDGRDFPTAALLLWLGCWIWRNLVYNLIVCSPQIPLEQVFQLLRRKDMCGFEKLKNCSFFLAKPLGLLKLCNISESRLSTPCPFQCLVLIQTSDCSTSTSLIEIIKCVKQWAGGVLYCIINLSCISSTKLITHQYSFRKTCCLHTKLQSEYGFWASF